MAFKRKRTYAPKRNAFKKRKINRTRRNRGGGPKTLGYSSLNTKDHVFGFRTKKTSRKAYKSHLWNSTLFNTHYRSILSNSSAPVTPATVNTGLLLGTNMYRTGGVPFWTTAGGLLQTDSSITPPLFKGDIILRGGVWECQCTNTSTTNDVRIKVWVMRSTNDPDFSFEPALPPVAWDPTAAPDFIKEIGKPYMFREIVLEQGNSYTLKGRFKLQKIDEVTYGRQGLSPLVYMLFHNVGHATATTINVLYNYNLSFSADAIGTT